MSGQARRLCLGIWIATALGLLGAPVALANPGTASNAGQPFRVSFVQRIFPHALASAGCTLFMSAPANENENGLWKSDGTAGGTKLLMAGRDLHLELHDTADLNGTLLFRADDGKHGEELWRSDGTRDGTKMVKDISPGEGGSRPVGLTEVNGTVFFAANDGSHGFQLWRTDGTARGTRMVTDIETGSPLGLAPQNLTDVNGTLYFSAFDDAHGRELWKSDGTAAATGLVTDINPGPESSINLVSSLRFTNVNGTVFFPAEDGAHNGRRLWKSNGTAAGTVMVADVFLPARAFHVRVRTNLDGTLFFVGADSTHGPELWKTDGTAAGTTMVKDILPGEEGSSPNDLTDVNGTLLFSAEDHNHGRELWRSDGTGAGTAIVKDVNPGPDSSHPLTLTRINDTLLFRAIDGTQVGIWASDGSEAGTKMVEGGGPFTLVQSDSLTKVQHTLFFVGAGADGPGLYKTSTHNAAESIKCR